jgi:hypothetical protein
MSNERSFLAIAGDFYDSVRDVKETPFVRDVWAEAKGTFSRAITQAPSLHPGVITARLVAREFADPTKLNVGEDDLLTISASETELLLSGQLDALVAKWGYKRSVLSDPIIADGLREAAYRLAVSKGFRPRGWMRRKGLPWSGPRSIATDMNGEAF